MSRKLSRVLCVAAALIILVSLAGCDDKKEKAPSSTITEETAMPKASATPPPVRNTFMFGHYEQDNDLTNGKEPIEWIVLDERTDGSLLLISKYALDCKPYSTERIPVAWKTCSMREWLNSNFCETAFSAEEQTRILTTAVQNEETPHYMAKGDYETDDRVWLLSIDEADTYYGEDAIMLCLPTKFAAAQGAEQSTDYSVDGAGTCWWWLRSSGDDSNRAAYVNDFGVIGNFGNYVNYGHYSVRPVMRILP
ncbi:MAG: hypothetical protein IJT99_00395 [Clostridia bacterium]|nr:hypothetical protein [Clostridia bacterium]